MRKIIFYSWQSDLPNATNRGLIEDSLEIAAGAIAGDGNVAVDPVIDRDTEGVAGSPDIASTIFGKISAADVVVADVTIVSSSDAKRSTPNPNVMVEVGYALKALGFERVVLVFNEAFGKIESLPFDLRMRRLVVYRAAPDDSDRASVRKALAIKFETALRSALSVISEVPSEVIANPAVDGIEDVRPNRRVAVRAELSNILKELDRLKPPSFSNGGTAEDYLESLNKTLETAVRFSRIAESVAVMADVSMARELYGWFGTIIERCQLPEGFSGSYNEADFDYFRFIAHEFFVTLLAFLLKEQELDIIAELLNEPIPVNYLRRENGPGNAEWVDLSQFVRVLGGESARRQRVSFHADLLAERHSGGVLGGVLPFEDFKSADFFLYLRGILPSDQVVSDLPWKPWSALYLKGAPTFLLRSQTVMQADRLARALAVPSVEILRARLLERGARYGVLYRNAMWWEYPIRQSDLEKIGSRN
jgi:hypothetical protein